VRSKRSPCVRGWRLSRPGALEFHCRPRSSPTMRSFVPGFERSPLRPTREKPAARRGQRRLLRPAGAGPRTQCVGVGADGCRRCVAARRPRASAFGRVAPADRIRPRETRAVPRRVALDDLCPRSHASDAVRTPYGSPRRQSDGCAAVRRFRGDAGVRTQPAALDIPQSEGPSGVSGLVRDRPTVGGDPAVGRRHQWRRQQEVRFGP